MVWLAPLILLFSPKFCGWLTVATALALFFLYNDLTGGLPWYIGIARDNSASSTTAWMIWPWATLLIGMRFFYRNTMGINLHSRTERA
jgi:hypothetical protein